MKEISFAPPDITDAEIEEVVSALRSGWITTGPRVKEFEKELKTYLGSAGVVCLNSQTACAEMTLRVLGIGPGDEVIVPAYTYTASCSVICHVGATPVLIDSQKDVVEMDYDAMEKAITPRTKVIIPVDLGGIPCDYEKIFEIVNRKKVLFHANPNSDIQKGFGRIIVMADTAHSLGATRHGVHAGNIADFSNFSFHAVKNLTTAEGGCVSWKSEPFIDNDALYHQYQLLSLHGQSKDALSKNKLGAWEYDIIGPYYKCNMTDIMAAIGIAQLKRYPSLLARRHEIIDRYNDFLKDYPVNLMPHFVGDNVSSGHLYSVRFRDKDEAYRNAFIEKMAEKGVATNVHYKPLPMFTAYKKMGFDIRNYLNALNLYKNEMTLPLHTKLTDEDVGYILKSFGEVFKSFRS